MTPLTCLAGEFLAMDPPLCRAAPAVMWCAVAWFLCRWAPLSEGLFDVADDAQMGIFRVQSSDATVSERIYCRPLV